MAKCDILWLGDDPESEADGVFKIIQDLAGKVDHIPAGGNGSIQAFRAAASAVLGDVRPQTFKHVLEDRPVWTRAWIIQEVVVAQSITLQCGLRSMPWNSLSAFLRALVLLEPINTGGPEVLTVMLLTIDSCSSAIAIDTVRTIHSIPATNKSIPELWQLFYNFGATDPRDRIFALLGLSTCQLNITCAVSFLDKD
jgi:hypothetical protein